MNAATPLSIPDSVLGTPMVYLVDDEEVVRDALAWLLRSRRLLSECHDSAEAFYQALFAQARDEWPRAPSCLVLDIRMAGMSGIALFERLTDEGRIDALPVIFLTGHGDVPTAVAAVKRGAFDFVEKPFSDNALVDRIQRALEVSAEAIRRRIDRGRVRRLVAELTDREREVMEHVVAGRPNKLIARLLDISVRTVEVHRARLFEKMGARSAVELANRLRDPG